MGCCHGLACGDPFGPGLAERTLTGRALNHHHHHHTRILKLMHLCFSFPALEKANVCWSHYSCCWRTLAWAGAQTVDNPAPNRPQSSSPSFWALHGHYFIYQMPISLRRVREYFEEIVKWFVWYFVSCLHVDVIKNLPHSRNIPFSMGHTNLERFVCRSCGRGR